MATGKEIWMIIDDQDDQELTTKILQEINSERKVVFFSTAEEFMEALNKANEAPFIVLCEVNLPKINGFVMRQHMLDQPNTKFHGVPFIFWSLQPREEDIRDAFRLRAHGFFLKESTYAEWKISLTWILGYWEKSLMPSKPQEMEPPL